MPVGQNPKSRSRAKRVLVLHGPNLNLLGEREPEVYGRTTLSEIDQTLAADGVAMGIEVECFQSNHEGMLIDRLHAERRRADGILINPGGLTHSSVALRDAVAALSIPVIEVHLSNLFAREPFRHQDLIAPVCVGSVMGLGADSYRLALMGMRGLMETNRRDKRSRR